MTKILEEIDALIKPLGLVRLGVVQEKVSVVLIGNVGPDWWQNFKQSQEFSDGLRDPMNRYSQRLGQDLADQLGLAIVYPFGGPPYQPFLRWASVSGASFVSSLGPMIHPDYGLWQAYRMALIVPDLEYQSEIGRASPCDTCTDKPCLSACPVNAIGGGNYDVPACVTHIADKGQECLSGCKARRACPVGKQYYYGEEQAQFHMGAFFKTHHPMSQG